MTLADDGGLQTDLPHETHQAFVEQHSAHFAKVLMVDYISRECSAPNYL